MLSTAGGVQFPMLSYSRATAVLWESVCVKVWHAR